MYKISIIYFIRFSVRSSISDVEAVMLEKDNKDMFRFSYSYLNPA